MPIGKNALKRVSNNGYSKVNTSAPDMEHSEIIEPEAQPAKSEPVKRTSVKTAPKKNTTPKEKKPKLEKPEVKKAEPKKAQTEKPEPKAAQTKPEADSHPDGFVRYGFGDELPAHLL